LFAASLGSFASGDKLPFDYVSFGDHFNSETLQFLLRFSVNPWMYGTYRISLYSDSFVLSFVNMEGFLRINFIISFSQDLFVTSFTNFKGELFIENTSLRANLPSDHRDNELYGFGHL
jgi:hypothetical protein